MKHIQMDFFGCDKELLFDYEHLKEGIAVGIEEAGLTLNTIIYHDYENTGYTILCLLEEGYLTMQTFCDEKFCAVDVYSTWDDVDFTMLYEVLNVCLGAAEMLSMAVKRGHDFYGDNRNVSNFKFE